MERYVASHYRPERERAYHVSLWAGPSTYGLAVHTLANGRCVGLWTGRKAEDLREGAPHAPVGVSMIVVPEWSTLVPEHGVVHEHPERHLTLVHADLPTGAVRNEVVAELGARCIHMHAPSAEQDLLALFPTARPMALQALLARTAQYRSALHPVLLLHRSHHRLDVAVGKAGAVLLSNTFHARSAEDVLYFCLLVAERTVGAVQNISLLHAGPDLDGAEIALLRRYFPVVAPAAEGDVALEPPISSPERWLALLEQFACA
jgi:Protein of unknown function (DUF3822)